MQVNPSPPPNQGGQAQGQHIDSKQEQSSQLLSDHAGHRYDGGQERASLAIDDVLLHGNHQEADFQAMQHLQRSYGVPSMNHVAARGMPRRVDAPQAPVTDSRHYPSSKPVVGSEEWYKVRKDNHKEVERRRRETINKGIDELAQVVPDCDKHKGQILSRAVDYIKKLKDNEQKYLEKLTLEKLLAEQAIAELSNRNKTLKNELAQTWKELEEWKRQAIKE